MPSLGAGVQCPWHLHTVTDCHLDVTLTLAKVEIDGTAIQALEIGARAMAEAPTASGI